MPTSIVERLLAERRAREARRQAAETLDLSRRAAGPTLPGSTSRNEVIEHFLKRFASDIVPVITRVFARELASALQPLEQTLDRIASGRGLSSGESGVVPGSHTTSNLADLIDPEADPKSLSSSDSMGFPLDELRAQLESIMGSSSLTAAVDGTEPAGDDASHGVEGDDEQDSDDGFASHIIADAAPTQQISEEAIDRAREESSSDLESFVAALESGAASRESEGSLAAGAQDAGEDGASELFATAPSFRDGADTETLSSRDIALAVGSAPAEEGDPDGEGSFDTSSEDDTDHDTDTGRDAGGHADGDDRHPADDDTVLDGIVAESAGEPEDGDSAPDDAVSRYDEHDEHDESVDTTRLRPPTEPSDSDSISESALAALEDPVEDASESPDSAGKKNSDPGVVRDAEAEPSPADAADGASEVGESDLVALELPPETFDLEVSLDDPDSEPTQGLADAASSLQSEEAAELDELRQRLEAERRESGAGETTADSSDSSEAVDHLARELRATQESMARRLATIENSLAERIDDFVGRMESMLEDA